MYVYTSCLQSGGVTGSGNSAADQIPLLLKMNEDELALQKVTFYDEWMIDFYTMF